MLFPLGINPNGTNVGYLESSLFEIIIDLAEEFNLTHLVTFFPQPNVVSITAEAITTAIAQKPSVIELLNTHTIARIDLGSNTVLIRSIDSDTTISFSIENLIVNHDNSTTITR